MRRWEAVSLCHHVSALSAARSTRSRRAACLPRSSCRGSCGSPRARGAGGRADRLAPILRQRGKVLLHGLGFALQGDSVTRDRIIPLVPRTLHCFTYPMRRLARYVWICCLVMCLVVAGLMITSRTWWIGWSSEQAYDGSQWHVDIRYRWMSGTGDTILVGGPPGWHMYKTHRLGLVAT